MKCIECGKYPFCNNIEEAEQDACDEFIKRTLKSMENITIQKNNNHNQIRRVWIFSGEKIKNQE